jgi:hypothetical protein
VEGRRCPYGEACQWGDCPFEHPRSRLQIRTCRSHPFCREAFCLLVHPDGDEEEDEDERRDSRSDRRPKSKVR